MAPTLGFNEPGSPVTLALPDERAAELAAGGAVELVDPEGLPLATVTGGSSGWSVRPLTHAQYGPFRRLYLPPSRRPQQYAGRTFVPVTDAVTDEQLAAAARPRRPSLLLALVGRGTPSLSPVGLLRATLRVADLIAATGTRPTWSPYPSPRTATRRPTRRCGAQVVANYAGPDPVVDLAPGGVPTAERRRHRRARIGPPPTSRAWSSSSPASPAAASRPSPRR